MLTKIENQLQAARRIYNTEVKEYNNLVTIFHKNTKYKSKPYKLLLNNS